MLAKLFESNRNAVSLSAKEIAVLSIINENGKTGICVADISRSLFKVNEKQPRLTTVYDTVFCLEKKGLIQEIGKSTGDGRPRRLFSLSNTGSSILEASILMIDNIGFA